MYKRNNYQKFTIIVGANCVGLRAQQPLASYTYDDNGIRTSKTFGDTTTYYTNVDGAITSQYCLDEDGAVTDLMQFLYDGSNELLGFTYNGATYFYVKNLQGDVVAVIDSTGTEKAVYEYGTYGTLIYSGGDLADVNPMRYRGYYYDSDAGMYYLQSRYYAPEFAKFINSDLPEYAQQQKADHYGTNLFAYCCNDPVNNSDPTGNSYFASMALTTLAWPVVLDFLTFMAIHFWYVVAVVIAVGITIAAVKKVVDYAKKTSKGKKAKDSSKNEPHGNEAAKKKAEKQAKDLKEKAKKAKSKKERKKILQKAKNVLENGKKQCKGETHHRK